MGQDQSSISRIPETEFTNAVGVLKKLGYSAVLFRFEDLIHHEHRIKQHVVERYNKDFIGQLVKRLSDKFLDDASTFIATLVSQGVLVIVTVDRTSEDNGAVTQKSQYVYDGPELVTHLLHYHFGPELAEFIRVIHAETPSQALVQTRELYPHIDPSQCIVVHHDPEVIQQMRRKHIGAMTIEDHVAGFRV